MAGAICYYIEEFTPPASISAEGFFNSSIIPFHYESGNSIHVLTPNELKIEEKNCPRNPDISNWNSQETTVTLTNTANNQIISIPANNIINLPNGTYGLEYKKFSRYVPNFGTYFLTFTYTFSIFQNHLPLKKWTITDIIVRSCDLIEPLRYGQKPRFRLDGVIYDDTTGNATGYQQGSIAEELDKIIAPEYAFTKMTFREQMQQVGGYIARTPRIFAACVLYNFNLFLLCNFNLFREYTFSGTLMRKLNSRSI